LPFILLVILAFVKRVLKESTPENPNPGVVVLVHHQKLLSFVPNG